MPIYEYECKHHGVFEVISSKREETAICQTYEEDWTKCGAECPIVLSAPSMQPDRHWSGSTTPNGVYVTSKKEYEAAAGHLAPADRNTMEHIQAKSERIKAERERKHEAKVESFIASQLAGVDVSADTSTVSGTNKFNRMNRG